MEHDLLPVYEKKIGIYVSMIMIDFLIIHNTYIYILRNCNLNTYLKRYFFCKQKHDLNFIPPTLFHIKARREFDQQLRLE